MKYNLEELKKEVMQFVDLYGESIASDEEIDACKNILDLAVLIEQHHSRMESAYHEASNHLDRFKNRCGIN